MHYMYSVYIKRRVVTFTATSLHILSKKFNSELKISLCLILKRQIYVSIWNRN